jgi:2-iminobutanoate/2-iminopropanoate deaminase
MPPNRSSFRPIISKRAPKAVGNYSAAVVADGNQTLYVSGQIPIEMPKGTVFTGDIKKQAELCMTNLRNIVQDARFAMEDVVKCTIFITNMENYEAVNEVYGKYFVTRVFPARAIVGVAALPKGVGVEIEAVAVKKVDAASKPVVVEEMFEEGF